METTATELLVTRVFDVPRALLFQAWTDQRHLERWFSPLGCSVRFKQLEVTPGGTFTYGICHAKTRDYWFTGEYKEVQRPSRLSFTARLTDESGQSVSPTAIGVDPEWPSETLVTITFKEHNGRTTLTLQQTVSSELAARTGALAGWQSMLEKLAQSLG